MAVVPPHSEGPVPRSLADALSQGPLPLPAALRFANDLAGELRDLHEQSRAYGKLTLHSVSITESGARLMPVRSFWDHSVPERDIQAFGQIFYQMLHGNPPPATLTADDIRIKPSATAPARLRASSTKLALRCISPRNPRLSMQQVATELRLLTVMQRQEDANTRPENDNQSAPSASLQPTAPAPMAPPLWTPPVKKPIDTPGTVPLPPTGPIEPIDVPRTSAVPDPAATLPVVLLGPDSFGAPNPRVPAKASPAGGSCPKCAYPVVYVSRARSRFELLLERMRIPIVRCHRCYHRYIVIGRFKFSKEMPVGSARKFRPGKHNN